MERQATTKSKYQHGSVVRLYLRDFMQYTVVEMKPGPTLNVIIGPNGAGKSSVVNGLALALGLLIFRNCITGVLKDDIEGD